MLYVKKAYFNKIDPYANIKRILLLIDYWENTMSTFIGFYTKMKMTDTDFSYFNPTVVFQLVTY